MTEQEIYTNLKDKFGDAVLEFGETALQPFITIKPEQVDKIAQFLRDEEQFAFDYLMCLSGVDLNENLGVIYHLYSMRHNHKIVLHTLTPKENPNVKSVAMLWRTADWHEREAYDMFGIRFEGHPDLRRILLPDDWEGYPLRKDYVQPEFYGGIRVPHPDQKEEANDDE
jgi:NADH-quinone oxidoreductase subunit C